MKARRTLIWNIFTDAKPNLEGKSYVLSAVLRPPIDLVFKHGFHELWQFDYGASFGALFAHPIKRAIISKLLMGNDPKLGNHKCRLDLGRFLFPICSKGSGTFLNHASGLSDIAVFVFHNERSPP